MDSLQFRKGRAGADQPVRAYFLGGHHHGEVLYIDTGKELMTLPTKYDPASHADETNTPMHPSFLAEGYTRRDEVVFNFFSYGNHLHFTVYVLDTLDKTYIGMQIDTLWRDLIKGEAEAWVRSWR